MCRQLIDLLLVKLLEEAIDGTWELSLLLTDWILESEKKRVGGKNLHLVLVLNVQQTTLVMCSAVTFTVPKLIILLHLNSTPVFFIWF